MKLKDQLKQHTIHIVILYYNSLYSSNFLRDRYFQTDILYELSDKLSHFFPF